MSKAICDITKGEAHEILGYWNSGFNKYISPIINGLIETYTHALIYGDKSDADIHRLRGLIYGLGEVLGLGEVVKNILDENQE